MNAPQHTIAALLGPREAEVDCDECFRLLDQYVEDVVRGVDPRDAHPAMHAHLRGCPACAEEFASVRDFITGGDQA